jgi:hypothetical protein
MGSDTVTLPNYVIVYPYPAPQGITQNYDTLFAIAGATAYQWYYNGNVINGATDYFYVAPQSGNYNVVATDNNGCEVEAAILNVIASTQLAVGSSQLAIFPNPVSEELKIKNEELRIKDAQAIITIYNSMGEKMYSDTYSESIDCKNFPAGIYYLEIKSSGLTSHAKFLKQ